MKYVAVDIGCIECGEASAVIGVFKTRKQAEASLVGPAAKQRWHGQHSFEVFEVPD